MRYSLLNRNENVYGPAPACVKAIKDFAIQHVSQYIDGYEQSLLIPELARHLRVDEEHIILGYGAEDILRTIFDTLEPKDSILINAFHFTYYDHYLTDRQISIETFALIEKENSFAFDSEDCIKKYLQLRPKVLLITSPNNPTGNTLSVTELQTILDSVEPETLVVIDQVYHGFDTSYDEMGFRSLLHTCPNLLLLRSFSKLYALAGLRIGFALCGSKVKKYLGYQKHYLGFSRILEEVAIAALQSSSYYQRNTQILIQTRKEFIASINQLQSIKAYESSGNFVLIKIDPLCIQTISNQLKQSPVQIAKFVSNEYMRVSISFPHHMHQFLRLLQQLENLRFYENKNIQ